jgi:sterol desaturase/sphingolipid hydroxylase (fatty acid hydroxylase superfamily)
MIEFIQHHFVDLTTRVFESLVQPLLFHFGMTQFSESAFDGTLLFLIGLVEIVFLWLILGAAEKWMPAQIIQDKGSVATDVFYTLLHKLGLFALVTFFLLQPLVGILQNGLLSIGWQTWQVERLWPTVTDQPWVALLLYIILFDFIDYWLHRAQHRWQWWWQMHAIHHSQRDMTLWSDNRNHLFDDFLRDGVFALVALIVGVAPAQFVAWLVINRSLQSLQHANVRWHFGAWGERLIVSPSFHRLHHAIGYGHEGQRNGCNFGVLFTFWDQIFGTADFQRGFVPTGIRDQLDGVDYGRSFLRQQWLGLQRVFMPSKRPS